MAMVLPRPVPAAHAVGAPTSRIPHCDGNPGSLGTGTAAPARTDSASKTPSATNTITDRRPRYRLRRADPRNCTLIVSRDFVRKGGRHRLQPPEDRHDPAEDGDVPGVEHHRLEARVGPDQHHPLPLPAEG